MFSSKKRMTRMRSTSSNRTRSESATRLDASQRPSVARRALMMGLAMGHVREPESPTRPQCAEGHLVVQTPGGSYKVTGETVRTIRTPGGNVRCLPDDPIQPLCADVLERVEAMDMSDEEVEESVVTAPWHLRRWLQEQCAGSPDHQTGEPVCPRASAESPSGNAISTLSAKCVPKVDSAVDVRPSTSGMAATSRARAGRVSVGSDLDSDFDDEFDGAADQIPTDTNFHRDIPDSEQLEEPVREMILSLERAMDDVADGLGVSTSYEWHDNFESFRGVPEVFSGPTPGPLKDYDTPYDAFTDIWSTDIIRRIADETNRYATQTIESMAARGTLKPTSRLHKWTPTDADEILVLFSIFMYMAIDPRTSLHEYWKTDDYLEMAKFKLLMSYNRYILLNKFLHFVDNSEITQNHPQSEGHNLSPRLAKLIPIIVHLNDKFSALYSLNREICIDESLTLFKGRLSWVQTIRSKAARFGIKSYELCESQTGYMYNFQIYTGKTGGGSSGDDAPSVDLGGKSTKVVLDLLKLLANRGHCVTMDNFYNCPALARYLKSKGFDCFGTLRTNRRNVPADIAKVPKSVAKGTIISRQCGDISIVTWKDSKLVNMISTYHTDETYVGSKAGKVLVKPVCVKDYNRTMGGVDLKDQKLSMYLLERKRGLKWYIKMFKRLLNVSIHNAFILTVRSLARRDKLSMTHREFRYELAKSLAAKHRRSQPMVSLPDGTLKRLRKDIVHEPKYEHGQKNRKRCVVCYGRSTNKMVHSQCVTCGVFLCFENCWRDWHSLAVLKPEEPRGRKRSRI